ncbi:MAG: ASKHA domain-containing protein [Lachnospiraceae bacterium]|nr:ASKHA domain-containing protein [Lachnospiraceae bacterium]
MSEKIKITVVTGNEKINTKSNMRNRDAVVVTHDPSTTIMSTLLKNDLINGSFCGGRGDCGRCKIQFLEGVTMPTPLERSVMEPEELRCGYRLACLAKPKDDCVIKLALADAAKIEIVSDMIDVTESDDRTSQLNKQTQNHKSDVMKSATEKDLIIAVDLGTTTIAMQLMGMEGGQVIDTYCEMNPQRRYGSDVLSRIKASCEGSREILQRLVIEVLERGVSQFERCLSKRTTASETGIRAMCIAGNTTMEHLFMGYDVSSLGRSPFTPVEIGLQEYRNPAWDFKVWLVPGISTFVGGDIVAGLYALGVLPGGGGAQRVNNISEVQDKNEPQDKSEVQSRAELQNKMQDKNETHATILIDLGTNGEMAITDGTHMIVTATAAGPAFEGGAGAGVIGSDMIACAASLLKQGILDETGLLAEPYFTEGVTVGEPAVRLCNKDIRDLQMAKAAVRAGIEILRRQMGETQIEHIYLAGGFGYYLNVDAAFSIGLLPEHMRGRTTAVGNTSLAGAYMLGRDLWRGKTNQAALERSLSSIVSINLAEWEEFERLYVRYMNFCNE